MKTLNKVLSIAMIILTGTISKTYAQDTYSFAYFEKYNESKKSYALFVSDPIKNRENLSNSQKEDLLASFKMEAKKQAGYDLGSNAHSFYKLFEIPLHMGLSDYNSLIKCQEGREHVVEKWEKLKSENNSPYNNYKVYYINLYQN